MADPHISTIIKDSVTAIGIIAGGCWALWKWEIEKRIRRKREIPALDGQLKSETTPLNDSTSILGLQMLWRNPGLNPIWLDCPRTRVAVYDVAKDSELGSIAATVGDADPFLETNPHEDYSAYVLEPSTESIMQENLVLPNGRVYFVKWTIVQNLAKSKGSSFSWHRELVVHVQNSPDSAPNAEDS